MGLPGAHTLAILAALALLYTYTHAQAPASDQCNTQTAPIIINSYGNCLQQGSNNNGAASGSGSGAASGSGSESGSGSGNSDISGSDSGHDTAAGPAACGCGENMTQLYLSLDERVRELETAVSQQQQLLQALDAATLDPLNNMRDCADIHRYHQTDGPHSGVNTIQPEGGAPFRVYCEAEEDTLWTVIQHRTNNATNFTRAWQSYKRGFGDLTANHWLGLDHVHRLTNQGEYRLRVRLTDWDNVTLSAEYGFFRVSDEADLYRITYMHYDESLSGAGDALMQDYHNHMPFSTYDRDNDLSVDEHCAALHGGGWWFNDCDHSNLNGPYRAYEERELLGPTDTGIEWDAWQQWYSFRATSMSIAPRFPDTFRD